MPTRASFVFFFIDSSSSNSLVLLCSNNYKYDCPEQKIQPEYDTTQKQVDSGNFRKQYNPHLSSQLSKSRNYCHYNTIKKTAIKQPWPPFCRSSEGFCIVFYSYYSQHRIVATWTKFLISFWQLFVGFRLNWSIKMGELRETELSSAMLASGQITTPPLIVLTFWVASCQGSLQKVDKNMSKVVTS